MAQSVILASAVLLLLAHHRVRIALNELAASAAPVENNRPLSILDARL